MSQLASAAGLSNSFMSTLASLQANPSLSSIVSMAKALRVDPVDLLISPEIGREGALALLFGEDDGVSAVASGQPEDWKSPHLPPGFVHAPTGVLPEHRAETVKRWISETPPFLKAAQDEEAKAARNADRAKKPPRPAPAKKPKAPVDTRSATRPPERKTAKRKTPKR